MEKKKKSDADLHMETPEGGLKELVLRWFTETQAALILSDGNFPDWFQGFAARKDTEDLLRDKALGCFLIRLSDKAIGYILSYKGHDRCRHFVITQNPDGQFIIAGDCQPFGSLTELIQHYRTSPIQPFGEHLTSSCYEVNPGELYDVVNYKSGVSVRNLRTLWDPKNDGHSDPGDHQRIPQQSDAPAAPPSLPPKSKSRKLTGAVSVDTTSLSQGVPPVPRRGLPLSLSLSGSVADTASGPIDFQADPIGSQRPRGNSDPAGITYSDLKLVESRSQSLLRLNDDSMEEEEEEYSNHLAVPSITLTTSSSPAPLKRVTCHTYSLHDPRSFRSEQQDGGIFKSNVLYQVSSGPGGGDMYAEVPPRMEVAAADDTYELIPGEVVKGNTYESLEDMKSKKSNSTWGKNNIKWRKFLPDYMKK